MATHAMIDLETLGTKPDCVILTLGAIKFDPFTNEEPQSGLYDGDRHRRDVARVLRQSQRFAIDDCA